MMRWAPSLAVLAALAAFLWWLVALQADRAALREEVASLEQKVALRDARLASAAEAARVQHEYRVRTEQERAEWSEIERDLRALEGRDAPLSPFLRSVSDRLFLD